MKSALILGLLLLGCDGDDAGGESEAEGEAESEAEAEGEVDIDDLGTPCSANSTCPSGIEPVTYCGFGGCEESGTFCSCEVRCVDDPKNDCPPGTICWQIADGPGAVCRPPQ